MGEVKLNDLQFFSSRRISPYVHNLCLLWIPSRINRWRIRTSVQEPHSCYLEPVISYANAKDSMVCSKLFLLLRLPHTLSMETYACQTIPQLEFELDFLTFSPPSWKLNRKFNLTFKTPFRHLLKFTFQQKFENYSRLSRRQNCSNKLSDSNSVAPVTHAEYSPVGVRRRATPQDVIKDNGI